MARACECRLELIGDATMKNANDRIFASVSVPALIIVGSAAIWGSISSSNTLMAGLLRCGQQCVAVQNVLETMWQGRWAMWSFVTATATLVVVIGGFWQTQRTMRAEYRPYVRLDIERVGFSNTGNLEIEFKFNNYGRSPARKDARPATRAVNNWNFRHETQVLG